MTNQTPEQDQNQVNALPWTNGRGLITGATILAVLTSIIGTFYLYGSLAGANVWTGTNTFATLFANNHTLTLSGSTQPPYQAQFIQNLAGSSTIVGNTWGANTLIGGNQSDNASLAEGGVWDNLLVNGYYGGTSFSGGRIGTLISMIFSQNSTLASNNDGLTALQASVSVRANGGGTGTGWGVSNFGLGANFGENPSCIMKSGATWWHSCAGQEIDVGVATGASVDNITGSAIVLDATHAVQGIEQSVGQVISSQIGASVGFLNGVEIGNHRAQWPIDPNGYLFQTSVGANDATVPSDAAGGIDLLQTNFTGTGPFGGQFAFRSEGVSIDRSGRGQFGYGLLDGTSGGLTISTSELLLSGTPTIAVGGSGFSTGDYVSDVYGNIFTVTASSGVVTAVTVYRRGYVTSAPSNPISETAYTRGTQYGQGLTLNESWAGGSALTLEANGSGTVALGSGTDAVSLPVVGTGTPVASLCLDASNHIIKKTTAGSCI